MNLSLQLSGSSLGCTCLWLACSHSLPLGGSDLDFTEQLIDMHQIALYIPSGETRSLVTTVLIITSPVCSLEHTEGLGA